MATVTSSRRRGERSSGSTKVAASKPKLRQTSVANRGVQSGTPKPGTYTSNNTMAKNSSPTNKRGGAQRKTGGQAGGRAGRPSGPVAGTKDKTVRVPSSWKAQTVDPTNQRGGNQRPTGGLAGGRAGRPSGNIARPAVKPPATPKPPITRQSRVQGRVVKGTDTRPSPSTRAGQSAPPSGGKNLFGGAGNKPAAVQQAGPRAPKPQFKTNPPPFSPKSSAKPSGNFRAPSLPKGAKPSATIKNPNIISKGLSSTVSPKGVGLGAAVSALQQLPEEIRRARTGYYNFSKPNAERYSNLKNALGGVAPEKFLGTKLSGKSPTPSKPKAKSNLPALKGSMVNGKIQMTQVAKPKKPTAKPAAPKAAAPSRSTAPARTTSSRTATKPAATKPKASSLMGDEFSKLSPAELMKGYGMRVNQTFSAESPTTPKKRQSLKDQVNDIRKMIEESKKRQGKG